MNYFTYLILLVSFFSIHHCNVEVSENLLRTEIVRKGSDVKMSCFTVNDGNQDLKTLTMEWIGPLGVNMGNGSTLYLRNLQPKDYGNYTCRAYIFINHNLIRSETATQFVAESMEIYEDRDESKNTHFLTLLESQSLDVQCEDTESNENRNTYIWIKSDGLVLSRDNRLYIDSVVQKRHQGKYFCFINDKNLSFSSIYKTVIVKINIPSLKIETLPTESIKQFGMIHRRCLGLEFSSKMKNFNFKWINSNNLTVSESRMLQLPINDLSMLGEYQCIAEHILEGLTYTAKTIINSNAISEVNVEEYRLSVTSFPAQFRFYEDLSMSCQLSPNNANFDYQWFKNDTFISSGQVLNIKKFNVSDIGIYKCVAFGMSAQSKDLMLEAYSYQRICNFQHVNVELTLGAGPQIIINEGQLKELHCEINTYTNSSGLDVKWQFNKHPLRPELLEKLKLSRFDGKLTSILVIQEAHVNNEGHYKCIVGEIEKSVNVVVHPGNGFVYVHPQKIEVVKGDDVEFHCRIDGINNISNQNLKWTFISKNGTKIDLPNSNWKISNPSTTPYTSFITTANALMEYNGYFVCEAPNGATSRGLLIVREPKRSITVTVTPQTISIHNSQKFEFECYSGDMFGNSVGSPVIRFLNGSDIRNDPRFTVTEISPSRIKVVVPHGLKISESQLNMTCGVYDISETIHITIKVVCPQNQRSCRSGECINSQEFCDGKVDCEDGSDEEITLCQECVPGRLPCGTLNSTFNINWRCDGEKDCPNGFDEENCTKPDVNCNTQIFTCNDNTRIPYGYVCDKRSDCSSNEDEIGCLKPQITSTSENNIRATIGTNITMICEAVGYPLPKITWRYNWGCLLEDKRITVTEVTKDCGKVISVLQISNFQQGDDAIYGCEAISSNSRAFGNDFFVKMN